MISHEILLSVLIATMPSRKDMFTYLTTKLLSQVSQANQSSVEIIYDDRMGINIGEKRNQMLQRANGLFSVFIDDDDDISFNYIELILSAIQSNPSADAIGMKGCISFNGSSERKWVISIECKTWHEENNVYYRTPNHISPVKTKLAKMIGFPSTTHGEDYEYSMGLLPHIKSEVFIDSEIYHYKYIEKK